MRRIVSGLADAGREPAHAVLPRDALPSMPPSLSLVNDDAPRRGLRTATRRAVFACAVAAAGWLPVAAAAESRPLRLGLPAARLPSQAAPSLAQAFALAAARVARERFAGRPGLELVSQGRCDAIAAEISGDLRRRPADPLAEFRRFQAVDAVAWWSLDDEHQVEVLVCTESGTAATRIDARGPLTDPRLPPGVGLVEVIGKVLPFVVAELPITAADREVIAAGGPIDGETLAVASSAAAPDVDVAAVVAGRVFKESYGLSPIYRLPWKLGRPNLSVAAEVVRLAQVPLAVHAEETPAGRRTSAEWLAEHGGERWAPMVKSCYLEVLGTPVEPSARRLAVLAPAVFAPETIALVRPLLVAYAIEDALDDDGLDAGLDSALDGPAPAAAAPGAKRPQGGLGATSAPRSQRLGALRMLGPLGTPEAVEMLAAALGDADAEIRVAAAFSAATAEPPPPAILSKLGPLAADADPAVAFLAALALERAGRDAPRLLPLARTVAAGESFAADEAAGVVARLATAEDAALLRGIVAHRPAARVAAIRAVQRLGLATGAELDAWLGSSHETVVMATLEGLGAAAAGESLGPRLLALADDPFQPVAAAAQAVLRTRLPTDPWERRAAALRAEHPYGRERTLDELAADPDPRALAILEQACGNRDAQVRATALRILAGRDPAAARRLLPAALADPNEWGAFHAAVLAPQLATPELVPALEAAAARPLGSAAQAYLAEALAAAAGRPVPAERPPVRPLVHPDGRSLAWGVSPGVYAAESPLEAFYCLGTRPVEGLEKASRAGKVIVARITPIGSPAEIVLDPAVRDDLLRRLDAEVGDRVAAVLDGIVYGEETLEYPTDPLWPRAWPLFCRDAALDEDRVAGRLENLTPGERRAWEDWIQRIHVRGYNLLHDLTKLRVGKLRPGLAVGTFQPLSPAQRADFIGIYDYKGDNRLCAYDLVRSLKLSFPGRPVLWLSLGIGGYEMNPVRDSDAVPTGPLADGGDRAWADAVTAWLAGADTGWFSLWLFIDAKQVRSNTPMAELVGRQVGVDDIGPASPVLDDAIRWAFAHRATYEEPEAVPEKPVDEPADSTADDDLDTLLGDPAAKRQKGQDKLDSDNAARMAAMRLGFLYYQQFVYDCARIVTSLPRPVHEPQGLVVRGGVDVWTRPATPWPLVPAAALLSRYDAITDFNQLATLDLSGRRLLVVHAPALVHDAAIRRIDAWLRDTPGLLVVHRDLPAADDAEASTVEDHDGRLEADWPWEEDVACQPLVVQPGKAAAPLTLDFGGRPLAITSGHVAAHFTLTGTAATSLASVDGRTVLAAWTKPGYRGAVLFDGLEHASHEYLDALRRVINDLRETRGVGTVVEGPALLETLAQGPLRAAAATRSYRDTKQSVQVPGIDLLTGGRDAAVGRLLGSVTSVTAAGHAGRHVAASAALVAVAERPFAKARIDGDSLALEGGAAVRITSATGGIEVTAAGRPVAVTRVVEQGAGTAETGPDGFGHWLFASSSAGLWEVRRGAGAVWYLRAEGPVVIRPVARPVSPPAADAADVAAREAAVAREAAEPEPPAAAVELDLGGGVSLPLVRIEAIGGWAGRFEVTNEQFRRFRADHASGPGADAPRQPAVNVSYADATAFARWVTEKARGLPAGTGARLPRADEWLALARCGDGRAYPWGAAWPPTRGNYDDRPRPAGSPTAAYRDGWPAACDVERSGRNEWGLFGVGGNVWEWTDEPDAAAAGWAIRRGGAWAWELRSRDGTGYAHDLRCDHRSYAFPDLRHAATGLRIVVAPAAP
jgi:hypothetical protein